MAEKAGLSKDEQKAAASGLFPKDYRAGKESLLKILEPWNRTEPPSAAEVESHRKELSTWLENAKSLGWTRKEVYDLFLELLRQKCDPLSDRATNELGEIADRLTGFCPDDFLERFPGDPVDREAFVAYVHRAAWRQPPTMK